jgi:hypothetical protein
MRELKEIKNNVVNKSMLKVLRNKNILFLENDNSLHDAVGNFETWLVENKVRNNVLYDVQHLSLDYIKGQIDYADVIAFQTTWTYEVSQTLREYLTKLKNKKIIIECYISEPTWWRKPKGVIHDIYVLHSAMEDMDDWDFKKLRLNKAIWED